MGEPGEVRAGDTWIRKKDGTEVEVVDAGTRHGFVTIRWPATTGNGMIRARRVTHKRRHYFLYEFRRRQPTDEGEGDDE